MALNEKHTVLATNGHAESGGENPFAAVSNPRSTDRTCAVVVTYFPDPGLTEHLQILLPQVDALVIVDNTPGGGCANRLETFASNETVSIIEIGDNIGVAAALNTGLEQALKLDCPWLLTLDQDTQCYPDMMETLLHVYAASNLQPAVIGGNYLDPRNRKTKVPEYGRREWLEQTTVITSGCLVDAAIARDIGGFKEEYFIDQVDHEFCLRVRAHGYKVVITRRPVMTHSVGEANGPRLPFLGALPGHPPLRKYYITRNSLVTVANYWRTEPGWCLRRTARLLSGLISMTLLEKHGFAKLRAFKAGAIDAVHRQMGPCRHAWPAPGTQQTNSRIGKAFKIVRAQGTAGLAHAVRSRLSGLRVKPANAFQVYEDRFMGKTGLEIGGPSRIFSKNNIFPVYPLAGRIDNCNFGDTTAWERNVAPGYTFRFDRNKPAGLQYIAEATALKFIDAGHYDFLLSSHVLEHIANPLLALSEWTRLLKKQGTLVLLLPHKDKTFDHRRPVTALEHLIEDFQNETTEDDLTHLPEILALHDLARDPEAGDMEAFRLRSQRNIENRCLHHHVFDTHLAVKLLEYAKLKVLAAEELQPHHILLLAEKTEGTEKSVRGF